MTMHRFLSKRRQTLAPSIPARNDVQESSLRRAEARAGPGEDDFDLFDRLGAEVRTSRTSAGSVLQGHDVGVTSATHPGRHGEDILIIGAQDWQAGNVLGAYGRA